MSYIDRLKVKITEKSSSHGATKATEAPFVPFVASLTAPICQISAANDNSAASKTYWSWLLFYANREPMEAYFTPEATHAEVLEWFPDAVAAEPIYPSEKSREGISLSAPDEAVIRAWLDSIGETEQAIIDDVLDECREDTDSLAYYIRLATKRSKSI